jgi:hypothetical protein
MPVQTGELRTAAPLISSRLALAMENALITWRDLLRVGSSTLRRVIGV